MPGSVWDYGTNLDYNKELSQYWRTKFEYKLDLINVEKPLVPIH